MSLLQVLPIMEYLAGHPQAIAVKSGTLKFKSLAELEAPLLKPGGGDGGSDDEYVRFVSFGEAWPLSQHLVYSCVPSPAWTTSLLCSTRWT